MRIRYNTVIVPYQKRPDLELWYEENLDEQTELLDKVENMGINVIANLTKIRRLQLINQELDARLHPVRTPGRVDIYTELKEVN